MSEKYAKAALKITIPVLIAVFSIFVVSRLVSSSNYVKYCTEAITQSRDTVLKLTASGTAASAAITMLPGDMGSPIATEIAEISKSFLIVLGALYLEKFIVAVAGTVVFKWLVPIACGLSILGLLSKREFFRVLAIKLCILSAALLLIVPVSVKISQLVETSYEDSISQVIESAENSAEQIQESVDGNMDPEEAGNGLGKIVQNLKNSGDLIANGTSQMLEYFEKLMSRFVESLAIMLVISCAIPLLVIAFFVWIVKALFQIDIYGGYKRLRRRPGKRRRYGEHKREWEYEDEYCEEDYGQRREDRENRSED